MRPLLEGKIVYLRILERSDIETTSRWINTYSVSDAMGFLPVKSLAQQYDWFDGLKNDRSRFIFAICANAGGRHIGNVALGNVDYISRHAMFSIFIAEAADRAKGAGTEASLLLLRFAFHRLNLNKVYLRTSARYEAAIRVYERLGFVKEGAMRQHYYIDGVYEDKILYSILRTEFDALHENAG